MAELLNPSVDFSPLANLGNVYKQAQADALRQQTLANLGQGGQVDADTLLRSGDLSLAQLGISLRNRQEDQARQAQLDARQAARDKVTDSHWAQDYALRKATNERAGEDKYTIKEVTNPDGSTALVRIKTTGQEGPIGGTSSGGSQNPFSEGGKFNNEQGKAAGFTDRMLQSESVLRSTNGKPGSTAWIHDQGTSLGQSGLSKVPGVGNYLISEDRQKYEQAKRDFINAQLRRESGAAISPTEFESADKQYFPIPGDSQDTINQKAKNRRAAVEAMGREGGASYRPKSIYTSDGRVVALPKLGEVKEGYRYKGGDPSDKNNWLKVD